MTDQVQTRGTIRLSVIVPAFNEAGRIGPTLRSIEGYLRERGIVSEAIVVDDGSADDTADVARRAWDGDNLRVLRQTPNQGKGAAIRRGMLAAAGDWRLFTDADNSTPMETLERFWDCVAAGHDVCIASRALPGSRLEQRQPIYRETMGRVFNLIVRAVALCGLRDTQCGFKMFSRAAAEAVFPRQTLGGWAFDVECLMIARGLGFRIAEVPARWINSPASRVSPARDAFDMFRDLIVLRRRYGRDGKKLTPRPGVRP